MVDYTERKQQLIEENEWLPKAIEMLNMRLIDRGFNCENKWLGYYDEYVLHYTPQRYQNYDGEWEKMDWGKLEIHEKHEVFNPYKYCGGKGTEYTKLAEIEMTEKRWETIEKFIRFDGYQVYGKKVDLYSNPNPRPRVEFINGSDVPINGYYE